LVAYKDNEIALLKIVFHFVSMFCVDMVVYHVGDKLSSFFFTFIGQFLTASRSMRFIIRNTHVNSYVKFFANAAKLFA